MSTLKPDLVTWASIPVMSWLAVFTDWWSVAVLTLGLAVHVVASHFVHRGGAAVFMENVAEWARRMMEFSVLWWIVDCGAWLFEWYRPLKVLD